MVVFDPPHIIRKNELKKESILEKKYGYLYESSYKTELKKGIQELFRILKPCGIFIFKWSNVYKKIDQILSFFPYKPLLGTRVGQKNNTHWIMFIKHKLEKQLTDY